MIVPGDKISNFRLREPHRSRLLDLPVRWGHGGLGEVTFMRTYSRRKPDGTQETWNECVVRCVEGMFSVLRTHADQNRIPWREERGQRLALEAAQRMQAFKWTPPGRGLQYMGTEAAWTKGGALLNNCAFVSTAAIAESDEECEWPFRFVMDMAMLGVGPGFDTAGAGTLVVAGTGEGTETVVVEDTREGWVDVVARAVRAALRGVPRVVPDVSRLRPLGAPLRLMGGTASGPRPLVHCVAGVQDVLDARRGERITSVDITDVMNLIGKCVVSGNIRRTAEIAFAQPGDAAFEDMKSFEHHAVAVGAAPPDELRDESPSDYQQYLDHQWTPADGVIGALQELYADRPWAWKFGGWRWCSNNSVFATVGMDYGPYGEMLERSGGDPGFAWLDLMRSHGRLRDPADNRDWRVAGGNPCATGDTLVWTSTGHRRFDELAAEGRNVQVLTRLASGRLAYRTMRNPRLTQRLARICRVTLETTHSDPRKRETTVTRVTPNHIFYLRDGSEVEAQHLRPGQGIDSVYRALANSKGYLKVNGMMEHHIPFEGVEGLGRAYHVHHRDEHKQNNDPDNLELMTSEEHNALNMRGDLNPMRRMPERHARRRSDVLEDQLRELQAEGLDVYQMADRLGCSRHTVSRRLGLYGHGRNHKVVGVEITDEYEDVYCGTVDETNRFYIALGKNHGVLIHNCLEQSLEDSEICNLVETYPAHHENYWDFQRSLKFSFMYAKAVTLMGTHLERTNEVVIRNRRIGCSLSGAADVVARIGRTAFFAGWCERGYEYVRYLDKKYSDWLGVRESVKRTSMKPSGTVSLVAGVAGPGAHFPKPTGYRLVRLSSGSPIVAVLRRAGYRLEPAVSDPTNTTVVYFPWVVPEGVTTEAEVGIWEQVKMAADLQYWWADNQVSYTATFTAEEAERGEVARVLTAFDGQLKGISFLKSAEGAYAQMPFTRADRGEVQAYAAGLRPLDWTWAATSGEVHDTDERYCDAGACEVRLP